jgi:hypothetical protein
MLGISIAANKTGDNINVVFIIFLWSGNHFFFLYIIIDVCFLWQDVNKEVRKTILI